MKQVLRQFEKAQVIIEEEIARREELFDNRSEKWQESEKGEEFQEKTERLQEMLDELIDWQMELGE